MATIIPEGEKIRKAVQFISDSCLENERAIKAQLIEKACLKFNLSPKEEEYLKSFYRDSKE